MILWQNHRDRAEVKKPLIIERVKRPVRGEGLSPTRVGTQPHLCNTFKVSVYGRGLAISKFSDELKSNYELRMILPSVSGKAYCATVYLARVAIIESSTTSWFIPSSLRQARRNDVAAVCRGIDQLGKIPPRTRGRYRFDRLTKDPGGSGEAVL